MDLAQKIKDLPLTPGVYLMKDSLGSIIYVGKSVCLKKRVQSYFQNSRAHPQKVKLLVRSIRDLDYIETDTEFEAFMLECRLIKELKPAYNKKMKTPQAYSYIGIRTERGLHHLEITHAPAEEDGNALYFGPYTSRNTVERAVQGIQECYKLMCGNPAFKHSACLNYALGLCIGMCLGGEAAAAYNSVMDKLIDLLQGKDTAILDGMRQRMADAAEAYDFEAAAKYRDYVSAVEFLLHKEAVIGFTAQNRSIAIVEWLDSSSLKLILLRRNTILFSEICRVGKSSAGKRLPAKVKSRILRHFPAAAAALAPKVSKHEIDEAQIIYSYLLGSSSCASYILIREEWLDAGGNCLELDEAVTKLLQPASRERPANLIGSANDANEAVSE
ncbi:MAG: UvrABC system subunit [Paenibacillaceae bacterium]|nr:UvrABC system subunit [Paenibacillaceae bacterium]